MRPSLRTALPIGLFVLAALAVGGVILVTQPTATNEAVVTVYKTPTCGCCGDWEAHMREAGFEVVSHSVEHPQLNRIKLDAGVPFGAASCHTAFVGSYVVEGHVPAVDIRRMLEEQPDGLGLAVPGMPIGSPGMEIEGRPAQAYDVLLLRGDGRADVFSHHPGDA